MPYVLWASIIYGNLGAETMGNCDIQTQRTTYCNYTQGCAATEG